VNAPSAGVVSRLRARLRALRAAGSLVALAAALGLAALAAVAADAALDLPEAARARAPLALAALAIAVLAWGLIAVRRLTELRIARALEGRDPSLGTAVTNAVQLARGPAPTAVGEHLRREAVAYGKEKARGLGAWPLARRGSLAPPSSAWPAPSSSATSSGPSSPASSIPPATTRRGAGSASRPIPGRPRSSTAGPARSGRRRRGRRSRSCGSWPPTPAARRGPSCSGGPTGPGSRP
jgi:hypothetical protein